MRTIITGTSLAIALILAMPVHARATDMNDLAAQVEAFNSMSKKALAEYRATGDYRRYQEAIGPALDALEGRVKHTKVFEGPQIAH